MPIYEYRCESCGHELDKMQKLADAPLTDCPACGKPTLKKLISAPQFRLKGSGWYETDFKKDNKKNLHEGSENKGSKDSKGKDTKTSAAEKKPAADKPSEKKPTSASKPAASSD